MQVHCSTTVHDGELPVRASSGGGVVTPYATIEFGVMLDVKLMSGEDCDRVIRAAVRAKEMLSRIGTPHEFTPMAGTSRCDICGDLNDKDHWRPGAAVMDGGEACPDCGQPVAAHATLDMARASAGPQAETVR
jgi:hypothetical protein